jgi:transcriptional regulator with XRE-family HTH domain
LDASAIIRLFGENVRRCRQSNGWSQQRLADEADLDRTYISDIERGARNPTLATAARLATALAVDVPSLLTPNLPPVPDGVDVHDQ